jgi:serine protease
VFEMTKATFIRAGAAVLAVAAAVTVGAGTASAEGGHHPLYMPNASHMNDPGLTPPPVCCIPGYEGVTGKLPVPTPVNMAYFGGHVQVQPRIYLVYWGWGQAGSFDHTTAGMPASDPDGAAALMTAFVKALGGTEWAGSQTQYYQDVGGWKQHIDNPADQFGGAWFDNTNPIHDNVSGLELAQEAERAVAHFGVTDLLNSQFVIATPQKRNEQGFNDGVGYCAWHDYTQPQYYPGVKAGIAFTNMPYVLNMGSSCGQNSVNTAFYAGRLDGFTIVVGHEIEETVTDPGAETVIDGKPLGAWYDLSGWENADKCAWAGYTFGLTSPTVFPGGLNNIRGNDGKLYAVQSLWSNESAGGLGYCAGNGNNLPA